eukprot:2501310-Ditylum_brightwellii.AAC.1
MVVGFILLQSICGSHQGKIVQNMCSCCPCGRVVMYLSPDKLIGGRDKFQLWMPLYARVSALKGTPALIWKGMHWRMFYM